MKTFQDLWFRLRPANRLWQYMEVKELSEHMELAKIQAREAIMIHRAAKYRYRMACAEYMARLKSKGWEAAA